MNRSLLLASILLAGLGCLTKAVAQKRRIWAETPGTLLLTGGTGLTRYAGDLNETIDWIHLRLGPTLDAGLTYRVSNRFSLRAETRLYYIYGNHQHTRVYYNNLSFHSLNPDGWLGVQVDIWPIDDNRAPIPYVFAGAGLTYLTPKASYQGQSVSLAPLHTEGVAYNRMPGMIRYGAGVPLTVSMRLRAHIELSYTQVQSDYVDDVSTRYPDYTKLTPLGVALSDRRPEIGGSPNPPGAQRGHPGAKDGYFIASLRLAYLLSTPANQRYSRSRRSPRFR